MNSKIKGIKTHTEQVIRKERGSRGWASRTGFLLNASTTLSQIFTPFYLPIVGLLAIFIFSYLNILPTSYKVAILLMTYVFTSLLPNLLIHIYRKYQGWSIMHLWSQEGRMIPYIISIACYFSCFYLMNYLHVAHIISSIIVAALFIQILCAIINVWFKISTHTAAIGGITGSLLAFAEIFAFNPMWWFCVLVVLGGLVGSSRMILRVHSLHQVVYGYLIGLIIAFLTIILI